MMDNYAAGLIDGEGYIGIRTTNKARGEHFSVEISVAMSDKGLPALHRMAKRYGGSVRGHTRSNDPTRRDAWRWGLTGRRAVELIAALRPAFLVKGPAADVALAFQGMVDKAEGRHLNGQIMWTDWMRQQGRMYVDRIKEANRRGPDPALPDRTPLAVYQGGAWWEPNDSLFGPVPFTDRLPKAGMMRSGRIYETPSSVALPSAVCHLAD